MVVNEVNVKERLEKFDWDSNPFTFRIYPDIMVGYEEESRSVLEAIDSNEKLSIVLGDTGAGKTNLLRWIHNKYSDKYEVHYLPKLPKNEEELLEYLENEILKPGFFSRMFKNYSLYNIYSDINRKINSKCVFLIDEGHEASLEVLRWLRTALDHIDNLIVVAAGLPVFVDTLKDDVNTLYSRATNILKLESLNKNESFNLIRERIEEVGGDGFSPFTQDAIMEIYELADGFPREILRYCDKMLTFAVRENRSIIDSEDVYEVIDTEDDEHEEKNSENESLNLTEKQNKIVEILSREGKASSSEVAEEIGTENYRSRSHAIRSVNNILKRLLDEDVVGRERKGRSYEYHVKKDIEEKIDGE